VVSDLSISLLSKSLSPIGVILSVGESSTGPSPLTGSSSMGSLLSPGTSLVSGWSGESGRSEVELSPIETDGGLTETFPSSVLLTSVWLITVGVNRNCLGSSTRTVRSSTRLLVSLSMISTCTRSPANSSGRSSWIAIDSPFVRTPS